MAPPKVAIILNATPKIEVLRELVSLTGAIREGVDPKIKIPRQCMVIDL